MRALVVYETMYGNTARVAQAIAEGIGEAAAVEVDAAPATIPPDVELLVVGGPTHLHGLSRDKTRAQAAERIGRPVISRTGIRDWLQSVEPDHPIRAAAFDTRSDGRMLLTGSAARGATGLLKRRRLRTAPPASFVLAGPKDPPFDRMTPSELERARAWGRSLAALLPANPNPPDPTRRPGARGPG